MGNFLDAIKPKADSSQLTVQELELLLILIKNSSFKGEQLELLYNIVVKLQQQFMQQSKK